MIKLSNAERTAWQSGLPKSITLEFSNGLILTNADIATESSEFEQSIVKDKQLRFGQCCASCFKTRVLGSDISYKGLEVTVTFAVDTYTYQLGNFKVYSDKRTSDNIYRDLVCYDALAEVLQTNYATWHNALSFPMTIKQYRDSFFTLIGIEQEEITLPNDNIEIDKNFVADVFSGDDVLSTICEINATFGYINNLGKFQYVLIDFDTDELSDSQILSTYVQGSLVYEDFNVRPIDQVIIRQTADDLGGSAGTAGNTYIIEDNPLMYGKSTAQLETVAQNFLNAAKNIEYVPLSVKAPVAMWLQLGDLIEVADANKTVRTLILNRTMSGITALMDTYVSEGEELYSEQATSTTKSVKVLKQQTNELSRNSEETQSTLTRLETDVNGDIENLRSELTQTANGIRADITANYQTKEAATSDKEELNQAISENYTQITEEYTNSLRIQADEFSSDLTKATQKFERHYFVPDTAIHANSGWAQSPANSLDGCLTFNDAGLTIDATSIADSSASRLYGVTYAFAFTGVGYYTTEWKFSFDEVPTTLARQILCRLMYFVTKDGKTTGYQIAFYIEVVNGVISITRSGGQAITPQEDGTYNITLNKPLVSNGREYFQVHALPGYKYTISNLEVYMDFASYTSSVTSTIAQRVDDIELSVSQLEQTTSANYVPATWADSSLQDWYYDDLTTYPMAGTTFDGNPSMDFDGTNCTDAGRVFQLLPLNITQTGTYNIQLKVTPNIALASGIRIFQSYYCIENPDPTEKSTRPYLRVTSYLSSSAQSANSSHEYSFTWTIPTTYTYNGYTATVVLTTYDNFGTAGIGFYYVPGTLMHYQDLKIFGTATDYAKAVIDIASNQIQQEVTRATSAEANLASRLTITENGLSAEVNRATTAEGNLSSRITANANSITTKVSAGAIASTINQTAQSVKINASKIDLTGYVTASSLTSSGTTTIDGSRITTGTISANRITLGDTANYSQLNEDTATKWGFSIASRPAGGAWYKMTTLARDRFISDYYTVNGGEYFRIKGTIWTKCTGATTSGGTGGTYLGTAIGLYCFDGNNKSVGIVYSTRVTATSSGASGALNNLVQLPSTARKMRVFVQTNGYAPFAGDIQIQNITVTRAMTGELIVDGSITAAKIAANAIEVGKIKDGAISTVKIADSAVTTAKIPSSAITTVKIADGAISAGKIAANAVTAAKIAANAVTAAKIAAGAITADKLSATAIDGKTITGATIQTAANGTRILMDTSSSVKGYNGNTLVNILNMSQNNANVIQMTIDAKNQLNIRTPKVAVINKSYGTDSGNASVTRTGNTDYVSYVSKNYSGADEGYISMWNDGGSWSVYCTLPVFLDVRYSRFTTIHGMQITNETTQTNKI